MDDLKHNPDYLSIEDVTLIVSNCGYNQSSVTIENYIVQDASNKMLGFLCDYWKLKVAIVSNIDEKVKLFFFIKAISRTNAAKASMVRTLKCFEKELLFYSVVKRTIEVPGIKPWSAKLIAVLNDAIVFQDLNALHYQSRDKFKRFDINHTRQALQALARFHASSIIYEEKKIKELQRHYSLTEDFEKFLDEGGYIIDGSWFQQCMKGTLETIRRYSKYAENKDLLNKIDSKWNNIWVKALSLSNASRKHRNVICHRDLWNNNILFHYKKIDDNTFEPDDCLFVDFQAVRYQPPAGDVMLILYCNLDPKLREQNMSSFLNYYYGEVKKILDYNGIHIDRIMTWESFLESSEEQRQWGLIALACLIPSLWINDDLTTELFGNSDSFDEILTKDKASFISKMIECNAYDYKKVVLDIYEEIVERYCS